MSLLKNLFGAPKLDGNALVHSNEMKEYAQLDLLMRFDPARPLHEEGEQRRWSRVLPKPYLETIATFQKLGWLVQQPAAAYQVTPAAMPFVTAYRQRLAQEQAAAKAEVHTALASMMTSEALTVRRKYENRLPLGKADWTGPEPQMNHSAVTRRIFFLDHWLLDGCTPATVSWLKQYAAEEHLWGAAWELSPEEIPDAVRQELARDGADPVAAAYWKANQLALYVDNQETWQRCKGGDHVRRIEIAGADDEYTCGHCRQTLGKQFLVARVPELPHRECTSPRGCRCRYEPVLEALDDVIWVNP